jgi:type IV pilus assembly protein PilX
MKQQGLVMVFALLILISLTLLGVASVSGSLLQSKMAVSSENRLLAFDAAEAAIAGVIFESEDDTVLSDADRLDPLSEARQKDVLDLTDNSWRCENDTDWINRTITHSGLSAGSLHTQSGNYDDNPAINSWSRTAYLSEKACQGSSNVIGGSNISCHVFVIKGCGQLEGSRAITANTLNVSVFAPASE